MTDGVMTLLVLGVCAEVFLVLAWVIERLTRMRPVEGPDRSRGLFEEENT